MLCKKRVFLCLFFQFFKLTDETLGPFDQWTLVECPARIDVSGGWSDTPPITYEHGGAVATIALLVEGKVSSVEGGGNSSRD